MLTARDSLDDKVNGLTPVRMIIWLSLLPLPNFWRV